MRPEIPGPLKTTFERMRLLQKQLSGITKRIAEETHNIENYQQRIAKLDEIAVENLSGSSKSYEKYKTSIRKLHEQLKTSREILEKLKTMRKPLDDEKRAHKCNLTVKLSNYILEYRKVADAELRPKLDSLMGDVEFFLNDCREIYEFFGFVFVPRDHLIPFRIPADFLADYRKNKAAEKPKAESTQTAPDSPQAPFSPDGTSIPSEPIPQPEAAQSAVVGEVPEPVTEAAALMDKKTIGTVKLQPSGSEMPSEGIEVPPELLSQPEATPEASNEPSETFLENSDLTCEDENNG